MFCKITENTNKNLQFLSPISSILHVHLNTEQGIDHLIVQQTIIKTQKLTESSAKFYEMHEKKKHHPTVEI